MITFDCKQGEVEWQQARVGIPTSSNFDKIITTKGEPSKQRIKYLYTLVGELLLGKKEETFQSDAMKRGVETEAEARSFYEITRGVEVAQVGICYPDEKKRWASSPDGLVGDDGLVEIKSPILSTHISYLLNGGLDAEYFQQLQGQLAVTNRKWVDILSYYPGLKPLIVRVEPDKAFQKALAKELELFCDELLTVVKKLRG